MMEEEEMRDENKESVSYRVTGKVLEVANMRAAEGGRQDRGGETEDRGGGGGGGEGER